MAVESLFAAADCGGAPPIASTGSGPSKVPLGTSPRLQPFSEPEGTRNGTLPAPPRCQALRT